MVEWNVEYDVDVLQSLSSFAIIVQSESRHLTIETDGVVAHDTVRYVLIHMQYSDIIITYFM